MASSNIDPDTDGISYYLDTLGYGFSIPSGSIDGITVEVHRRSTNAVTPRIADTTVQLMKAGSPVGTNKASATEWTGTLATATYGGSSDLWGTTWTTSEVNAANFGLRFQCEVNAGTSNRTAEVDFIRITITYTEGVAAGGPNRMYAIEDAASAQAAMHVQSLIVPITMPTV